MRPSRTLRPVVRRPLPAGEERWPSVATFVWLIESGYPLPGEVPVRSAALEPVDLDAL